MASRRETRDERIVKRAVRQSTTDTSDREPITVLDTGESSMGACPRLVCAESDAIEGDAGARSRCGCDTHGCGTVGGTPAGDEIPASATRAEPLSESARAIDERTTPCPRDVEHEAFR